MKRTVRVGERMTTGLVTAATLEIAHAAQVVAGRDAGGGAHDRARGQLVRAVFALQGEEAELPQLARLVLVPRLQARLHLAADAEEERSYTVDLSLAQVGGVPVHWLPGGPLSAGRSFLSKGPSSP